MSTKDPRIDAYIAKSAGFAQPILRHIRKLVHAACPQAQETVKWQMPHFEHHGIICGMAAFKQHCALFFWKRELIFAKSRARGPRQFGRITTLEDLPGDKILMGYVRTAAELNEAGVKIPPVDKPRVKAKTVVPDYFVAALRQNKKAQVAFEKFSPSRQREYIEWLTQAKRDETRTQRLATAIEWIAQGKSRNWKYERC